MAKLQTGENKVMQDHPFLRALQITDSFFPVGAFAYSDGLESAAAAGHVRDAASLRPWLHHFLVGVFTPCEGPALVKCMRALQADNTDMLRRIDEELTAIRTAAEVRAASASVGRRILSLYRAMRGDEVFEKYARALPHGNAAAAYAAVFFHSRLDERAALLAFAYNRLAGIVSAGLRLIAIGQQQGQMLLAGAIELVPDAAEGILRDADEPLRSFCPLLDIQQMNHQYVYSRLFRS
jgi:urease accessory protein